MSIVLVGSTSGSCTLQEQAVAGTTVLTLPTTSGTILTTTSPKAGNVIQVVSATKTDVFTTTTTSWVDITGLSVTITPTSATSKILLMTDIQMDNATSNQRFFFRFARSIGGSQTAIGVGDAAGSRAQTTNASQSSTGGGVCTPFGASFLDSPATTSSTIYKIQTAALDTGIIVVNRSAGDSDSASYARTISTITVMEIAA